MKDLIFTKTSNSPVYCSICDHKIYKNICNYKLSNYCMECYNKYILQEVLSGEQK